MTNDQLLILKADLATRFPTAPQTADYALDVIVPAYNAAHSPDFWVWRTSVTESEIVSKAGPEGTVWSWTAYIARTEAERDGWKRMFNGIYTINPSLPNVRQGIADIFSGNTNNAPAQRTHLLAVARRKATVMERLLATGTGTTAAPGTLTFEGAISYNDILQAWNLQPA